MTPRGAEAGVKPFYSINDHHEVKLIHDREYFRRRAAEERALAFRNEQSEDAEIAGQLALAYSALARKRAAAATGAPAGEVLQD